MFRAMSAQSLPDPLGGSTARTWAPASRKARRSARAAFCPGSSASAWITTPWGALASHTTKFESFAKRAGVPRGAITGPSKRAAKGQPVGQSLCDADRAVSFL